MSECRNYREISRVSVGSKLLSGMILFRLGDVTDKVLREEQSGFRKGRKCVDQIFILRLINRFEINAEKTKSLRLGISEDENVTFGNEKVNLVGRFTYIGRIIIKTTGAVKMLKVE